MKKCPCLAIALLAAAGVTGAAPSPAPTPPPMEYRLAYPSPAAGQVRVEIEAPGLSMPQVLVIPRAVPMGYGEARYDRFVSGVEAVSGDGKSLAVRREEGPRWRIEGPGNLRRVVYNVDLLRMEKTLLAADQSSRSRPGYVGILGYSVFGFLEGMEGRPIRLTVRAPASWPVFSTLDPSGTLHGGAVEAGAPDFYALADSQIAMGPELRVSRIDGRPPLFVATYAEAPADRALTARLAREALDAMTAYFGGAPFPRYTVLQELLQPLDADHLYGFSMEHLDSSTYFFSVDRTLRADSAPVDLERARFNFAHHIAHAWIPKRCAGEGYDPFPWELAPVLDTVWFSEGFAQYAAIVALAEGRPDGPAYREAMLSGRFRRTLEEAPAFLRRMSTVELSRAASTRYAEDFRTGSNSFSRGGLMAAEMDERIRAQTNGGKSLKDALRALIAWSRGERRGFRVEELPGLLERGTGVDVRSVFDSWMAAPEAKAAGGR